MSPLGIHVKPHRLDYATSHLRFRICIRQPSPQTQGYQLSYSIGCICKHKLSKEKATAFPQLFIVPSLHHPDYGMRVS